MGYKVNSARTRPWSALRFPPSLTSLFLISVLLVLVLLPMSTLGCSGGNGTTNNSSTGYTIKVFLNDTQIASLSLNDLLALPQVNVSAADRAQQGPTLLSALASIGVTNFSRITATGMTQGRIAEAVLILNRNEIDDEVLLDITNSGTSKLCGPNISFASWIRDINKLVVQ
jgi:hypothetical protein